MKPYIKEFDSNGNCTNPITAETPYLHEHNSVSRKTIKQYTKYRVLTNPITGEVVAMLRKRGNNRKNTCMRKGKTSRPYRNNID